METSLLENIRMIIGMVKVHSLHIMVKNMWVHIRIIEEMVMGHTPHPTELGTLGNGMVDNLGMGKYISKKEIS